MFSVYGTSGRLFQGAMEQLPRVGALSAVSKTRAIEPMGLEGPWVPYLPTTLAAHGQPTDQAHRIALAAYEQTRHPDNERRPLTRVDAVMSTDVIVIADTSTLLQAWHLLDQHGIGQAPVVSAASVLVGLLARADFLRSDRLPLSDGPAMAWRLMLDQPVTISMQTPVPSVAVDADIRRVARVLLDTGLGGLPVVEDRGLVIGFVSRSDILRAVVTDPPLDLWG